MTVADVNSYGPGKVTHKALPMTDEEKITIVRDAKISFTESAVLLQMHDEEPFLDRDSEEFHLRNLDIIMTFLAKHTKRPNNKA